MITRLARQVVYERREALKTAQREAQHVEAAHVDGEVVHRVELNGCGDHVAVADLARHARRRNVKRAAEAQHATPRATYADHHERVHERRAALIAECGVEPQRQRERVDAGPIEHGAWHCGRGRLRRVEGRWHVPLRWHRVQSTHAVDDDHVARGVSILRLDPHAVELHDDGLGLADCCLTSHGSHHGVWRERCLAGEGRHAALARCHKLEPLPVAVAKPANVQRRRREYGDRPLRELARAFRVGRHTTGNQLGRRRRWERRPGRRRGRWRWKLGR